VREEEKERGREKDRWEQTERGRNRMRGREKKVSNEGFEPSRNLFALSHLFSYVSVVHLKLF